jgi:hypothetical protein
MCGERLRSPPCDQQARIGNESSKAISPAGVYGHRTGRVARRCPARFRQRRARAALIRVDVPPPRAPVEARPTTTRLCVARSPYSICSPAINAVPLSVSFQPSSRSMLSLLATRPSEGCYCTPSGPDHLSSCESRPESRCAGTWPLPRRAASLVLPARRQLFLLTLRRDEEALPSGESCISIGLLRRRAKLILKTMGCARREL